MHLKHEFSENGKTERERRELHNTDSGDKRTIAVVLGDDK